MEIVFTWIGVAFGLCVASGTIVTGVAHLLEISGRHKTYRQAWLGMVALRDVKDYCSSKYPEIADVAAYCECPRISTSEFREQLQKKYPR